MKGHGVVKVKNPSIGVKGSEEAGFINYFTHQNQ